MFRIKDGKIKIFSKYVQMMPGTHTIGIDVDTGTISHTGGSPVVEYTLDEGTGRISITSMLGPMGVPFKEPTRARSWMNNRMISSGPLYEGRLGAGGKEISVFMEGFAFSYNYTSIAHTAMAIKPFRWAGGRVCFDDMFSGGGTSQGKYTALPSSFSCGRALIDEYDSGVGTMRDIASIYGGGSGGLMHAAQRNAMEFYGNSTSIVFSYRSFRKYLSFARGMSGLFECSLGAIGGNGASVEPDGNIPNVFDGGFKFSMFNLTQ